MALQARSRVRHMCLYKWFKLIQIINLWYAQRTAAFLLRLRKTYYSNTWMRIYSSYHDHKALHTRRFINSVPFISFKQHVWTKYSYLMKWDIKYIVWKLKIHSLIFPLPHTRLVSVVATKAKFLTLEVKFHTVAVHRRRPAGQQPDWPDAPLLRRTSSKRGLRESRWR